MFNSGWVKKGLLSLIYAAAMFTVISVSYIAVPDRFDFDLKNNNTDTTGVIASACIKII